MKDIGCSHGNMGLGYQRRDGYYSSPSDSQPYISTSCCFSLAVSLSPKTGAGGGLDMWEGGLCCEDSCTTAEERDREMLIRWANPPTKNSLWQSYGFNVQVL